MIAPIFSPDPNRDRGTWMRTYTRGRYYPLDPRPEDISIEDIAHHLSMLCRYGGACPRFYSVAEHSYLMSFIVPRSLQLCALLHDGTEAYVNDLVRPVKHSIPQYMVIEDKNYTALAQRFDLPDPMPQAIKDADFAMFLAEIAAFGMDDANNAHDDAERRARPMPDTSGIVIAGHLPHVAEMLFRQRYWDLTWQRELLA